MTTLDDIYASYAACELKKLAEIDEREKQRKLLKEGKFNATQLTKFENPKHVPTEFSDIHYSYKKQPQSK